MSDEQQPPARPEATADVPPREQETGEAPPSGDGPPQGPPGASPGTPPGPTPDPRGPQFTSPRPGGTDGFFDALRRAGVTRSDDRWVGGVAAGIAERFGLDPLLVRGILFVTFFLSGAGLVLYGAAWALLPERGDGRIHLQEALRGRFDVAMLGAIAAVVVGFSWGGGWWSWWDSMHLGWLNGLFWVAAVVAAAAVTVSVLNQREQGGRRPPAGPGWQGGPGPQGGPGWQGGPGQQGTPPPAAPWGSPAGYPPSGAPGPEDRTTWAAEAGPYSGTYSGTAPTATAPRPPGPPVPPPGGYAPRPPHPPRTPRPKGPGSATSGTVIGLSLLVGALLLVVDRVGDLPWPVLPTWAGVSVVVAGLAIVLSGFRGRTSGGLGWFAVVAFLVGASSATWYDGEARFLADGTTGAVSDDTVRVTRPDVAAEGFGVRFGDPTIDLSDLDLSEATGAEPVEVPVDLAAGDVTVVVPDGVPVRADVWVLAGSARWHVDGERREVSGVHTETTVFTNEEADDGEDPLLVLDVEIGAGQVTIEES